MRTSKIVALDKGFLSNQGNGKLANDMNGASLKYLDYHQLQKKLTEFVTTLFCGTIAEASFKF